MHLVGSRTLCTRGGALSSASSTLEHVLVDVDRPQGAVAAVLMTMCLLVRRSVGLEGRVQLLPDSEVMWEWGISTTCVIRFSETCKSTPEGEIVSATASDVDSTQRSTLCGSTHDPLRCNRR